MTRASPIPPATRRLALEAAAKGVRVTIAPDGTITLDPPALDSDARPRHDALDLDSISLRRK